MKSLELYLHIPFCVRKCNYCDFLSAPAGAGERAAYVDALCNELKEQAAACSAYKISSIFMGGGTPTILEAKQLEKIFEVINACYKIADNAEISVECNPGTMSRDKLESLKKAGVNRLSIGLQSADEAELKLLGRIHSFEEFMDNYRLARELGFSNINIDLMQSLPGQSPERARASLEAVLGLKPEHISVYSLIIEEGTPFFESYGSHPELLPDETQDRLIYHETEAVLKKAGYVHYEISNYALPGYECRHNCGYWRSAEYLGFGTGAASLFGGKRFSNSRSLEDYIAAKGLCVDKDSISELTREDLMSEFMFTGLRMLEGVSKTEFEQRFGQSLSEVYGEVLKKHLSLGTLEEEKDRIRLSSYGLDVCNSVMCEFIF